MTRNKKNILGSIPSRLGSPGERINRNASASWRDGRASSTARGYGYQWQVERADYLIANPVCVHCRELGIIVASRVVDHITPHRGDPVLFWDRTNWQALCITCHNRWKQKMEANAPRAVRIPAKPARFDTIGRGGGKVQPEADT